MNDEIATPRSLYIRRDLLIGEALTAWADSQGLQVKAAATLHVTIVYSRTPVRWDAIRPSRAALTVPAGGSRAVVQQGERGAVVLTFSSAELSRRHDEIRRDASASWDFDGYRPHVTLAHIDRPIDLRAIEPFQGDLLLGPEIFAEIAS